jgi:hypothetical protein
MVAEPPPGEAKLFSGTNGLDEFVRVMVTFSQVHVKLKS